MPNANQDFAAAVDALYPQLSKVARKTPLIKSDYYSHKFGCNVWLKLETLQHTGAFKVRGAVAKALSVSEKDRARGFLTASTGNHGMGVSYTAAAMGTKAQIYMPKATPESKIRKIVELGGEPVLIGDDWDAANQAALKQAAKYKMTYFHPFADEAVMQGQATIAKEILDELPETDVILCSIGGGGLISGLARYGKAKKPALRFYGIETAGADSMAQSLEDGAVTTLAEMTSVAESIGVRRVADDAFTYVKNLVDSVVVVDDDEALHAQVTLLQQDKILAEPAATCCLAALEKKQIPNIKRKNVVIVVCGANYPIEKLAATIQMEKPVAYKISKDSLAAQLQEFGIKFKPADTTFDKFFRDIKARELNGYAYSEAPASMDILARRQLTKFSEFFTLDSFRVLEEHQTIDGREQIISEASVRLTIKGKSYWSAAESRKGPVSALDQALHKILDDFYPVLKTVRLTDYRVRILTPHAGTDAITRVIIESKDNNDNSWSTVGISEDIISASYHALCDSYVYKLLKA